MISTIERNHEQSNEPVDGDIADADLLTTRTATQEYYALNISGSSTLKHGFRFIQEIVPQHHTYCNCLMQQTLPDKIHPYCFALKRVLLFAIVFLPDEQLYVVLLQQHRCCEHHTIFYSQ